MELNLLTSLGPARRRSSADGAYWDKAKLDFCAEADEAAFEAVVIVLVIFSTVSSMLVEAMAPRRSSAQSSGSLRRSSIKRKSVQPVRLLLKMLACFYREVFRRKPNTWLRS